MGIGFRVQGLGFRIKDSVGFRVLTLRYGSAAHSELIACMCLCGQNLGFTILRFLVWGWGLGVRGWRVGV
jgi:hypothetical protein